MTNSSNGLALAALALLHCIAPERLNISFEMVLMIVQLLFDISVHDFEVLFLFLRLRVNFEFF